jgi:hypothetical protein
LDPLMAAGRPPAGMKASAITRLWRELRAAAPCKGGRDTERGGVRVVGKRGGGGGGWLGGSALECGGGAGA